ncbi:MAG TPA: hypothetical protein DCG12_20770 [Planctomycetaceae bacterium]|nr:hypothetical protein [Planctomycetaceae bacterium]
MQSASGAAARTAANSAQAGSEARIFRVEGDSVMRAFENGSQRIWHAVRRSAHVSETSPVADDTGW